MDKGIFGEYNIVYRDGGREMIIQLPNTSSIRSYIQFEKEMYYIINNGTNTRTLFDAAGIESISLSVLRVLEKLRLEFGNMKITNMKPEVYEMVRDSGFPDLC